MEVSIVFIALFVTVFGIWYYYLKTRNSERLALISSGADASLFYSKKKSRQFGYLIVIILGLVFVAIGLGIISGHFLENFMVEQYKASHPDQQSWRGSYPQAYFTSIFIFTGLALISSYFIVRRLRHQEAKENLIVE